MKGRGWESINPELREIARRACTDRQLEVFRLHVAHDYGWRRIGLVLDLDEKTVRNHYRAAVRNIQREVAAMRGIQ